ncbi:MAG: protein kinase [Gemmatimonadota bacterium]
MTGMPERLGAALADRYRIERELGAGGMATVYLAQDIRHDRRVALKVLRPELSAIIGAQRFLVEIKTTANLQHPHILSLFDSGEAAGLVYYVMPYVEGESLRDRLNREKQLPVDEAVRIAREVLDALEYAHQKGIIHRDIKPENILLHGGHAMVADFGIALAASRTNDATRMTETGMSLGTPHYMAPEQAMGERDITARADIYALGAVLYEMLVAEPPFQGPTAQAIIARVMTEEPRSLTLQRRTIPPHVEAAVLTALAKLPADRFASASQFIQALGNPGFVSTATMARAAYLPVKSRRDRILAALPWVLLAVVGGLLAWSKLGSHELPPPPILRMGLELPAGALWEDQTGTSLALSADGTMLVYSGRDSIGGHLFFRAMDRVDPVAIAGTESANQPAFSADGRWIGYMQVNKIYRVPVTGGTAETMCSLATGTQTTFTWFDTRSLVVADTDGLRLCSMDGGFTPLYRPDSTDQLFWPHTLPNGRGIVFSIRKGNDFELGLYDADKHVGRSLGIAGSNPRYVTAGYLVYATLDGIIRAIPFDLRRLTVTGEPSVVMQGARVGSGGAAKIAVAPNGTMVTSMGQSSERVLELVNRSGAGVRVRLPPGAYGYPRFSPDGRQVAVVLGDIGSSNVWLYDRGQGTLTRLTFDSGASRPIWTNDGNQIVFARVLGTTSDLRIIKADGSASAESLLTVPGKQFFQALFTPDGRSMVVRTTTPSTRDIWRVPMDSTRVLRPLLTSPADERGVALSPDGHWMAYASDESGRFEVYVRAYPSMAARYQVSLDGGLEPVWSRQGNEILYRNGPVMMSARVRTTPRFEVVSRGTVFSNADYVLNTYEPNYDLSPDGRELLMVRAVGHSGGLGVTLNWFENLRAGRVSGAAGASGQ